LRSPGLFQTASFRRTCSRGNPNAEPLAHLLLELQDLGACRHGYRPVRYADIVVPHPVGPTNTPSAALTDGAAATAAESTKYDRYGPGVLPLAVETFGRWGTQALKWWRQLAKQVVALGDPFFAPALVAPGVSGTPARQRRLGLRLTRAGPVIWLLGSDDFAGGA
jgi:hypothetical protein